MSFIASLTIDGKEFDVVSCSYSFHQATDETGKPSSKVLGGNVQVVLDIKDDDTMVAWMINPYGKKDLQIDFKKPDDDSTLKTLKLEGAYCVGYHENFSSRDSTSMLTSLQISAGKITLGNASLDKKWGA